ncbi:MAG TPA: ubiquinone/menaquinone biosynthesis methyltransferase [Candidatus Binatus sp.]|nr:ubiquinone/menaquinone biosynthesis methyltransferase [Candidatus Binatus sp.]
MDPPAPASETPSGHATERGNAAPASAVGAMFDRLAPRYDLMNALISGFQEPRWRRRAIEATGLRPGMAALDVATGTGKVAQGLADRVGPFGRVVGIDVSRVMIERARRANADRVELEFLVGDALDLPLEDGAFDAATIAFGMRNLADYERGFAEMRRVLRPGGRVVCLEAARPRSVVGRLGWLWFEQAVPLLGRLAGHAAAYRYLVTSVRSYPGPDRIAEVMRSAGLTDVRWIGLTSGMVTLHTGRRPAAEP